MPIFYLVSAVGFEFVRASAVSKVVNCATNLGALVGTALATTRGSGFIRKVYFGVVSLLIISMASKLALG